MSTSAESSREGLAFLQRRVALFGLAAGGLSLIFLLFRAVVSLSRLEYGELVHPSFLLHLLAVVTLLSVWVACRTGGRSRRFIHTAEETGVLGSSVAYQLMGWYVPLDSRPDLVVLLAMSYCLMARAAYVPSSARRTLLLSVIVGVPLVVGTHLAYRGAKDAPLIVTSLAVWWSLTTVLTTATSSVIYGLRREVREARRLGQYTLEEKLGEGGMGVVYRARHAMLRRPTAVKLLPTEKSSEQSIARFEREVQLTAGLSHPNTVTVYDYGRTPEGVFYYAMELLDGAALDVLVELDGAQPSERALHVLDGVAGALVEAHEIGLIHRDVKPANIILCKQGGVFDVPKVVDFGLVKDLAGDGVAVTATAALTGTPLYMAPEAIASPSAVDARSDLYALGAVGYFAVTGTHVFPGQSPVVVCGHHLHTKPEAPSARLGRPVPPDLEALILDCLEKDAGRRPQTAAELQERIRACRAYGAWDRERARRWWQENGDKLRRRTERTIADQPTLSRVLPPNDGGSQEA